MAKKRKISKKTQKQAGGYLEGPSHEEGGIPAYTPGSPAIELEGGEYIINAATAATLGTEFLDKLNRTQSPYHSEPGFNQGELPGSNYRGGGHIKKLKHGGEHGRRNTNNIPKGLPESYGLSNRVGEKCSNCLYVRGAFCRKWRQNVGKEYLCKSWTGNRLTNVIKRGEM